MQRIIKKAAVLGSGVMGSRIACHLANAGLEVVLLDIVPAEMNEQEKAAGYSENDPRFRNRIVNTALEAAVKSNPSPLYLLENVKRIVTGNFDDHLSLIADCDWVIEAVVERLDIKQNLFERVEIIRKPGTLISSNTSGIPMHYLTQGRSDDFRKHFCGTHFFNPPRYLPLLEIIPAPETDPEILSFLEQFGQHILGKTTVVCKDTPAFIANRVGVYGIMALFHLTEEMGLTVEEVDKLTGPVLGRPKSATFRTCDVVGLDTLVHVANGLKQACPDDEENVLFELPDYIGKMVANKQFGAKSGKGFYQKVKGEDGKSEIHGLDLQSGEYRLSPKAKIPVLDVTKGIDDVKKRLPLLLADKGNAGTFYRKLFGGLFAYVSNRIPEISDELYRIDQAIKAGFGWELGVFESWDILGLDQGLSLIEEAGKKPADWVLKLKASGKKAFYQNNNAQSWFYNQQTEDYSPIGEGDARLNLELLAESNTVWSNSESRIIDLGDGIYHLSFQTKMNTIGGGVIAGIHKAIDMAEQQGRGLVISNTGANFSAGANVAMIFMMAAEQDYDELNMAVKTFQDTMMRVRYSHVPVIVAPHNLCLGGGCELSMHADKVIAHAELYMGLVEFGVGLIPGGGGTKEFAKRLSDELSDGDIRINRLRQRFLTIGQAKVSTSAAEAFELGYLRRGTDEIVMSREWQLNRAKQACVELADKGYVAPKRMRNITVLGQEGLGIVYVGANSMKSGNYISVYDQLMSEKLGFVLCGGDLSELTQVSEQYLLDLERKTFVELCQQRKTLERLQSLVKNGKILRN